jgi:RHS repeat-associated protein
VVLPSKTINYGVDAQNRRVMKKNGTTTEKYFIWNQRSQLIGVADGSGILTASFVYGSKAHVPDYVITSTAEYQIVSNHLGSPVSVLNKSTGVIAQEIKYDEFGNVTSDTNPGFTPFGFAGCLYDVETKLCRFGARDYDSSIGRWLSKDPILFNGDDTNLYGYVFQDPINYIDPEGLAANDPSPQYPTQQQTAEQRMCSDTPLEDVNPEDYVGAAAALRGAQKAGLSAWIRRYPKAGGGGIGINQDGKNLLRLDYHKINGTYKPHVDVPGKVKHWPWKK